MTRLCKICIQIVSLLALNTFFEEEVTFRIQWMYLITKASVKQRNRYGCVFLIHGAFQRQNETINVSFKVYRI